MSVSDISDETESDFDGDLCSFLTIRRVYLPLPNSDGIKSHLISLLSLYVSGSVVSCAHGGIRLSELLSFPMFQIELTSLQ